MKAPENLPLLINKYLAGQANDEEVTQLHDWYRAKDHSHVAWPVPTVTAEEEVYQRMLSKIDLRVSGSLQLPKQGFGWYKMMVAAVILVVASVGGYFFINGQKTERLEILSYKNDIAPAGNKTVLKLANGNEIVLDDAKAGELVQQGGLRIVKTNDGKLIYDLSDASDASDGTPGYNIITTPVGAQYQVVLSDGTKVWLNAVSSLRFPMRFDGKERVVETSGEVYFEVAKTIVNKQATKNPEKRMPFVVKSSGQQVEVLGTHFNINTYGDGNVARTTLLEGSIKINVTGSSGAQILKPGQQALVSRRTGIKVINVDADEVIAWKSNLFQFNNTPIDQVMQQLKRWYDIDVVYSGTKPELLFTGVIPKNNNISVLLNVLESTGGVKFGIEGKKVIIQSSPIKNQTDMKDR